jgi:DNA polymerase-3 subunit epsilon
MPVTAVEESFSTARLGSAAAPAKPAAALDDRLPRGTTICFTGALFATIDGEPVTRAMAQDVATNAGLVVLTNVSKKLQVLVVADPDTLSGKARRARDLGTRLMAEAVFWRAVGVRID